jgi:hypothetical protein
VTLHKLGGTSLHSLLKIHNVIIILKNVGTFNSQLSQAWVTFNSQLSQAWVTFNSQLSQAWVTFNSQLSQELAIKGYPCLRKEIVSFKKLNLFRNCKFQTKTSNKPCQCLNTAPAEVSTQ